MSVAEPSLAATGYCTCPLAGYCDRHATAKTHPEWQRCQGAAQGVSESLAKKYRKAWEQGAMPGQTIESIKPPLKATPGGRPSVTAVRKPRERVGHELKRLLSWFGMHSSTGCGCTNHANLMDQRGCDWCEANVSTIVGWLRDEAAKESVLGFTLDRVPGFELSAELLVKRAIANARAKFVGDNGRPDKWWQAAEIQQNQRDKATAFIATISSTPEPFSGQGIVVTGGGKYFASAYVTIRVIRHVGCTLPIELWHLDGEMDAEMCDILNTYNVTIHDASKHANGSNYFIDYWWRGWQLKAYALRHSSFAEVLMLDADCYPVRDPSFVFDWEPYQQTGAIFWPDIDSSKRLFPREAAEALGVPSFVECPTESGQIAINKLQCWREVELAKHYNAEADYVYHIIYGDKDTFPTAWHRLGTSYSRMWPVSNSNNVGIQQLDQHGTTLFNHRVHDKFKLDKTRFDSTRQRGKSNRFVPDWQHEQFCHDALRELRRIWKHRQ